MKLQRVCDILGALGAAVVEYVAIDGNRQKLEALVRCHGPAQGVAKVLWRLITVWLPSVCTHSPRQPRTLRDPIIYASLSRHMKS